MSNQVALKPPRVALNDRDEEVPRNTVQAHCPSGQKTWFTHMRMGKTASAGDVADWVGKKASTYPTYVQSYTIGKGLMASCRKGTAFTNWPCDELGRLRLGDKIGNKLIREIRPSWLIS